MADADVVRLYGFDEILGGAPAAVYSERNVKYLENPYSLSDEGQQNISMFKQAGGSRRKRRATRRRQRSTKRRGRRHY